MSIITKAITGGGNLFGGFPLWLYVIGALSVALVAEEGVRRVQTSELRAEVATEKAGRSKDRSDATEVALKMATQYTAATRKILKEKEDAQTQHFADVVRLTGDRDRAVAERGRVSSQLAAFKAASRRSAGDPGALPVSPTGGDPLDLLSGLFSRADQRAGELSEIADRARASGTQCEREYDAVKRTFDAIKVTP